jgi:hypothetical protein
MQRVPKLYFKCPAPSCHEKEGQETSTWCGGHEGACSRSLVMSHEYRFFVVFGQQLHVSGKMVSVQSKTWKIKNAFKRVCRLANLARHFMRVFHTQ